MGDPNTFPVKCVEFAGTYIVWEDVKGNGGSVIVGKVLSGNGLKKVGRVFDSTGHRTYCVLVLTDGYNQAPGGKSYSGLDTYKVIDIARTEDASACLGYVSKKDTVEGSFAYFRAESSES